ncbi:carboxylating nicotinate-nucleotide diphosphorylase [Thermodesulfobacteriota bacterium]
MVYLDRIIRQALEEDLREGDVTSQLLIDADAITTANIIAKEDFIVAGVSIAKRVFEILDMNISINVILPDGSEAKTGEKVISLEGGLRSILAGERVALNFLQHLSAIATVTNKFAKIANKHGVNIVDTRKTTPNLRFLEKEAVVSGGGKNHRMGLYDRILIKDNHITYCDGSIARAVKKAKDGNTINVEIEVETKNLDEVKEAVKAGADIIMFDNMPVKMVKAAKKIVNKKALTEVSGGINLKNIEEYAKAKPDYISIGALTHSAGSVDITLLIED